MEVPDLWFTDGTIVIRAEAKLFCLHAGFLSALSDIFRDIIADKNLEGGPVPGVERSVDISGLPLIMIPDSGNEAHTFFLAIYNPGFFELPPAKSSTDRVISVLKLSTKYQVHALRRRALAHLNVTFPMTLSAWDNRINLSTTSIIREAHTSTPFQSTFEYAIAIVNIAKSCNAPWIMPAALYECCTFDIEHILKSQLWTDLDEELRSQLVLGAFRHRDATDDVLRFLLLPFCQDCESKEICAEVKRRCKEHVDEFPKNDPLSIWDHDDWEAYLEDLCNSCHEECLKFHAEARSKVWSGLPELYGLPAWKSLELSYETEMATL